MENPAFVVMPLEGMNGSIQNHVFVPDFKRVDEWTPKPTNISLCGQISANVEGDDYPSDWDELVNDKYAKTDLANASCRNCLRIAKKRFANPTQSHDNP